MMFGREPAAAGLAVCAPAARAIPTPIPAALPAKNVLRSIPLSGFLSLIRRLPPNLETHRQFYGPPHALPTAKAIHPTLSFVSPKVALAIQTLMALPLGVSPP
jgi:hypothetical protein